MQNFLFNFFKNHEIKCFGIIFDEIGRCSCSGILLCYCCKNGISLNQNMELNSYFRNLDELGLILSNWF